MVKCHCVCQIQKGKLHGCIDVGLSVMSIKKRARRIDLDTEEHIYHLKVCVCVCDLLDLYVRSLKYCGENQCFFNFRYFYVSGVYSKSSFCSVKLMPSSFVLEAVNCLSPDSLSPSRWSLQMFLTSGCVSCATIACSVRTRSFVLLETLRWGRSPRLPAQSLPRTPLPAHRTRSPTPPCLCFSYLRDCLM